MIRLRIRGRTEVALVPRGPRGDGATMSHEVALSWEGFIDLTGDRIASLVLVARGREKLRWGNARLRGKEDLVSHLPAGSLIDLETSVRYGVVFP